MIDFAPLHIRQTTIKTDHITRYRVEQSSGKPIIVEASSAAEAFRISGVMEATRIINLDVERLNLLASGLLQPEAGSVSTNISLDEESLPEFIYADVVEDSAERSEFEEMSLGDLSALLQHTTDKPSPHVNMADETPDDAMQSEASAPEAHARELTPEEIRRLLNSEMPE